MIVYSKDIANEWDYGRQLTKQNSNKSWIQSVTQYNKNKLIANIQKNNIFD